MKGQILSPVSVILRLPQYPYENRVLGVFNTWVNTVGLQYLGDLIIWGYYTTRVS